MPKNKSQKNEDDLLVASQSKRTQDHDEIKNWVEERGGRPSVVKSKDENDTELLRIDFGKREDTLDEITWDHFFEIFDRHNLFFLYQEKTSTGETSKFFKFVR